MLGLELSFFAKSNCHSYIWAQKIVPWCNWLTRLTLDNKGFIGSRKIGDFFHFGSANCDRNCDKTLLIIRHLSFFPILTNSLIMD